MLVDTLHAAGTNPWSWAIVGAIGAVAGASLYKYRYCPYLCHKRTITPEESAAAILKPVAAGPRFVLVMLAGIAAILAGLHMLSAVINPPLALLLIVVGVFVVQIEPALLQLREAVARVVAAQTRGPEAVAIAEDRLRAAHLWMALTNVLILLAVIAGLLAF